MGPYYDHANLDRFETGIAQDRMIELTRLKQGIGSRGRPMLAGVTTVLVTLFFLLFLPML